MTAPLRGVESKGLRVITAGGLWIASLGFCAAAEVQKESSEEARDAKKGELAPTTVIANRIETELDKVGSSVTVLDAKELDRQGIRQLDDALKFVPGILSHTSSGQRGATSGIFMRGNETAFTGYVVDGIRMSNNQLGSGFSAGSFLGTGSLVGVSDIEVLKGPQGVLYGANAMAGVVGISQAKGEGAFGGDLRVEGGSFDSWNTVLSVHGQEGDFSYSLYGGYETTDNDLPNNAFESFGYGMRLDYDVTDVFRVGLTFRGFNSELETPVYSDPNYRKDLDVDYDYYLTTLFAEYDINELWSSKVTLGFYDENYETVNTAGATTFGTDSEKLITYWDNVLTWNDCHTTLAGFAYEDNDYKQSGKVTDTREQYAVFANHIWDVTEQWNVTGGVRWEDYSDDRSAGIDDDHVTWRVATAYTVEQTGSILRGSIGTGFQQPTFFQLYNRGSVVNELDPAESIGWDVGIEQPFCDDQYSVGLTYFATRVTDAISYGGYDFGTGGYIYENNEGVTETSGVEASAKAHFLDERLTAVVSYTWLDRQYLDGSLFLPEHTASLILDAKVCDQLNVGLTVTYMDDHALYGEEIDGYGLVNLYGNYKLNDNIAFNARVDNLFDENYEYGVAPAYPTGTNVRPGRGIGAFAGVTVSW